MVRRRDRAASMRGGEGSDSMERRPVAVEVVGGRGWDGMMEVDIIVEGRCSSKEWVGEVTSSVEKELGGEVASSVVALDSSIRRFRENRPRLRWDPVVLVLVLALVLLADAF